ncbi:MAG: helix-turn-helix domain-containing protein [Elusimicrobia bacterium]|nr:helix-turn-helix domain-containing protein [Elusimicrobiota bacterium]
MNDRIEQLVSIKTLGQLLEVPEKTIRTWVWKRQVPYYKLGKLIRFSVGEIRTWYRIRKVVPLTPSLLRDKVA